LTTARRAWIIQRMMNLTPAIEVRDLVVIRGGKPVIDSLSASVAAGSVTGLLGPSGCGKTTLIRCIAGIQIIRSGTVTVLGQAAGAALLRPRVGYMTQASSVYPDLTVRQNLRYFADLAGGGQAAITAAIDNVGLGDKQDSLTGNLSGGERTRVSLAAVLLADPDIFLLDEPTVGLDPVLRRDLWQLFAGLAEQGKTLLVSSHVMDEAARCQRVLLMRDGGLVADDTPAGLRERTGQQDLEQAFLTLAERTAASTATGTGIGFDKQAS
jgi:ABC-2 type transport system ATP-binding protein